MAEARKLIVIGASIGAVSALKHIVAGLPADFQATVLIVVHIGGHNSALPEILSSHSALPVGHASDREPLEPGTIRIAPPDHHLLVETDCLRLSHGPKENFARPAIDPLFRSAAMTHRKEVIGVVLTGELDDGTVGLQAIKRYGGTAVVQDPADAEAPSMPRSALEYVDVDLCLPLERMADELVKLVVRPVEAGRHAVPGGMALEDDMISRGLTDMEELDKIAKPSPFTCPECQGTLWEVDGAVPQRFRCHTGHGFTEKTLSYSQDQVVEDAIWAAIRALHEREAFLRRFAGIASDRQRTDAVAKYEDAADRLRENARVLMGITNG